MWFSNPAVHCPLEAQSRLPCGRDYEARGLAASAPGCVLTGSWDWKQIQGTPDAGLWGSYTTMPTLDPNVGEFRFTERMWEGSGAVRRSVPSSWDDINVPFHCRCLDALEHLHPGVCVSLRLHPRVRIYPGPKR